MFIFLRRLLKVLGFSPKYFAAPKGPSIRPSHRSRACSIRILSTSLSLVEDDESCGWTVWENWDSSIVNSVDCEKDHRPFDDIFQFPNIARPIIVNQPFQRSFVNILAGTFKL